MRRERWVTVIAALMLVVSMAASVGLTFSIDASVGRNKLVYTDAMSDSDRPEVALGVAMGAFRGLFVNYLWVRANDLKEEGKYYEAVELARAITRLQPRFPRVWVFHAWNLAYNISVATQTDRERWNWVRQGIELLRDEGIPANPHDATIHKELAWIYFHKVQGFMDDANWYYKKQHALEWAIVLGPPPKLSVSLSQTDELTEAYAAKLEAIAAAPLSREELARQSPAADELANVLSEVVDLEDSRQVLDLLQQIELNRSTLIGWDRVGLSIDRNRVGDNGLMLLMINPAFRDGWQPLLAHLRHRLLVEKYHMDVERMVRYTRKYGPLDWRHPAAHSLYWAAKGVEETLMRATQENQRDAEILNTDRLVLHSVQELFRTGNVYFDVKNPDMLIQLQNVHFIPVYERVMDDVAERGVIFDREGREVDPRERTWNFYTAGYENFLRDAIRYLYRLGDREAAEHYFDKLRNYKGQNVNRAPWRIVEMSMTLDEFVENQIREPGSDGDDRTTTPHVALSEITGSIDNALINGLLRGDEDLYRNELAYARLFHQIYTKRQIFNTWVNAGDQARLEFFPRDFNEVVARQVMLLMTNLVPIESSAVYKALDEPVQRRLFRILARSDLRIMLEEASREDAAFGFEAMFPPPPGETTPPLEEVLRGQAEHQNNTRSGTRSH